VSKSERISWLIVIGLVILLFLSLWNGKKTETIEIKTTDTIVVYKYDTIVEYKTRYITERVLDTVVVYQPSQNTSTDNTSTPLLITQRHFSSPKLYDLWVSGYKPNVDSIKIYQRNEYNTITNEVIKEIYPKVFKIYAGVGFQMVNDIVIPTVGATFAIPEKWAITGSVGYYKGDWVYGVQAQYLIFGNTIRNDKKNRRKSN
jgi:hypothetical protein